MSPDPPARVHVVDHPDLVPPRHWGDDPPDLNEYVWCPGCRRARRVLDLDLAWLQYFEEWTPVCPGCGMSSWLCLTEYEEARRLIGPDWPGEPPSGEQLDVPSGVAWFDPGDVYIAMEWLDDFIYDTGADSTSALEGLHTWTQRTLDEQVRDLQDRGREMEANNWRSHRTPRSREELRETAKMIRRMLDEYGIDGSLTT